MIRPRIIRTTRRLRIIVRTRKKSEKNKHTNNNKKNKKTRSTNDKDNKNRNRSGKSNYSKKQEAENKVLEIQNNAKIQSDKLVLAARQQSALIESEMNSRFSESIDHFFLAIGTNKYAMSQHLSQL